MGRNYADITNPERNKEKKEMNWN